MEITESTDKKLLLTVHGLWYYKNTMKTRLDNNKYNIGKNLRQYRLENKLTQEEATAKLNFQRLQMSRGTCSHIECGVDNIRVEELLALAEILGVEAGDFLKGDKPEVIPE